MKLQTQNYVEQAAVWPAGGKVILAQFDAESVIVYQAFHPDTGRFAAEHGRFGEGFSLNRMTWIKPNFLWMMYRSSWGTGQGQQVVLAVRMRREAFDQVLRQSVHSSFHGGAHASEAEWRQALADSDVRLQWDPDHAPDGRRLARRAIQLGLRRSAIRAYAREWILDIEDISDFVAEQRGVLATGGSRGLVTPRERPYPVDAQLAEHLGLPSPDGPS